MTSLMKSVKAIGQMAGVAVGADYDAPAEETQEAYLSSALSTQTTPEVTREAVASKQVTPTMEREAALRARKRSNSGKWSLNVALFLCAVVVAVYVLSTEGVSLEVVSSVAVIGLVVAWLMGWFRGRTSYPSLFEEELAGLIRELLVADAFRSRDKLVDDVVHQALGARGE